MNEIIPHFRIRKRSRLAPKIHKTNILTACLTIELSYSGSRQLNINKNFLSNFLFFTSFFRITSLQVIKEKIFKWQLDINQNWNRKLLSLYWYNCLPLYSRLLAFNMKSQMQAHIARLDVAYRLYLALWGSGLEIDSGSSPQTTRSTRSVRDIRSRNSWVPSL